MTTSVTTSWRPLSGPLGASITGEGPRLVFAHGFTQTAASWKPIAEHMATLGHECVIVDMPGHGDSAGVRADLRRSADLLAAVGGTGTYVGYSMGGRVALHTALMYPHLVNRLALIGANPGIDDDQARAERRAADDALAEHLLDVGVDAFLDEWVAQPLFGGVPLSPEDRAERLRNTPEGLASSLRMAGTGAQGSLWPRLHELTMPVLVMAGSSDEKFVAIGEQLAGEVREGKFVRIADAAHAAHLQQPWLVSGALAAWLPVRRAR